MIEHFSLPCVFTLAKFEQIYKENLSTWDAEVVTNEYQTPNKLKNMINGFLNLSQTLKLTIFNPDILVSQK